MRSAVPPARFIEIVVIITPYPRLPRLADVRLLRILRQKQGFKALKLVGHSPSWFKNMKGEGTPPPTVNRRRDLFDGDRSGIGDPGGLPVTLDCLDVLLDGV